MWRHLAASVQGASHVRSGVPCQDFSVVADLECGLLLACSDGAGSARRADVGAETACRALVGAVRRFTDVGGGIDTLTMDTAAAWLDAVRAAIQSQADAESLPTREFACTLLAALVGEASSAFLQIGDGAIVAATAASSEVVFWPDQGEYANTTYFVTGPDAHQRLRLDVRPTPVHDVALFTDGLQHIALRYETRAPHQPFFDPMFARLRADDAWPGLGGALASFLGSEAISTRTDDDCTLVLACRCEA